MTTLLTISSRRKKCSGPKAGFTLIEIIAVIAVISLLLVVLIPAISGAQRSAAKSKTRSQFAQYIMAYEAFRADNGYYPSMGSGEEFDLKADNQTFIETLSGSDGAGNPPGSSYARKANPRRIPYYTFIESEFAQEDSEFYGQIIDGLGNPNIFIVIDQDMDGIVPASAFQNLDPSERPQERLRGGVFIYSANPSGDADWEWIKSWE